MSPEGQLVQAVEEDADMNITYNYSCYFYEAAEHDARFYRTDEDGKFSNAGIRGINGKSPAESIPMLTDMISRIKNKYQEKDGTWKTGHRTKKIFYDKNGKEIDFLDALSNNIEYTSKEIEYYIDEGDTNNYWEKTAMNAIEALTNMLYIATDALTVPNCVWEID